MPARKCPAWPAAAGWMAVALLAFATLAACSAPPQAVTLTGSTMGTVWSVRLAAPADGEVAVLREGIEAVLEQINAEMSTYREESLISRFNRAPAGERFELPPDFAAVLDDAISLARATGGAFDPTVGPLVNLWGFGPDGHRDQVPDADALELAWARVGHARLDYTPGQGWLVQPGDAYLDFSAIAKGHAVDRIAGHLIEAGVEAFVVDIGGDLRTRGQRPDGRPWRIAVERPRPGERSIHSILEPGDMAMATSGSYRNFFRDGGRTYSHTIDPRSGRPVTHTIVSVTVLHPRCGMADALATAFSVLDPAEGMAFARSQDLAVLWLLDTDEGIEERMSPAFIPYLQEADR